MTNWQTRLADAHGNDHLFPRLSAEEADPTPERAYELQKRLVDALPGAVIGYKAALTAAPAQAAMQFDQPISGALFDWGARRPGAAVSTDRPLLVETELGYRLNQSIETPVSAETVPACLASCHPMIELASPNLDGKPTGVDLIAANSASYAFIEGAGATLDNIAIDSLTVTLTRDGQGLHTGNAGTVMEGQANAIAWLINHLLTLGYPVEEGMLLMSGAIGPPHPGKPGTYRAEFGPLEPIEFQLT